MKSRILLFVGAMLVGCAAHGGDVDGAESAESSDAWQGDETFRLYGADLSQPNLGNAYWMAKLSEISYHPFGLAGGLGLGIGLKSALKQVGAPTGDELVLFENTKTDTQGFVLRLPSATILVFRGSEQPADFVRNTETKMDATPLGRVHHGFYTAMRSVWDDDQNGFSMKGDDAHGLRALLEKRSGVPLIVTGHSQGGALATLALAQAQSDGLSVSALYTFGAPRAGDVDFGARLGTLPFVFRFVNAEDMITGAPNDQTPSSAEQGGLRDADSAYYFHPHRGRNESVDVLYLTANGDLDWGGATKEYRGRTWRGIWSGLADTLGRGVGDHMIFEYTRKLGALASRAAAAGALTPSRDKQTVFEELKDAFSQLRLQALPRVHLPLLEALVRAALPAGVPFELLVWQRDWEKLFVVRATSEQGTKVTVYDLSLNTLLEVIDAEGASPRFRDPANE